MAERRKVNNLLGLAVLSYLTQAPMHPYELSRTLRENDDGRSIKFNHGSLYMVVQQLAKAGFVAEQETTRSGLRPERTVYSITDAGRQELQDWMRELVEEPQHEYTHFVAALSLIAALPPDEVVRLLRNRLERLAGRRSEIRTILDEALAADLHPLFLVEEEYRLALLDTEVTFVQDFIGRITNPDNGWGRLWLQFLTPPPGEEIQHS